MTAKTVTPPDVDLSEFEGPDTSLCKLGRIHAELNDDRKQKLEVALNKKNGDGSHTIAVERIVDALRGWGYSVSVTSVRTHRRKVCACASRKAV